MSGLRIRPRSEVKESTDAPNSIAIPIADSIAG